ncbi:MAG: hypothetical protein A2289_17395 [Deltaproteobacteria bacterium RIFOXYA12_FULL_58_15]|nr:MAG: hypothetical protein A2289_17395 [Deltaproteobacteria bacterium RIFOXYA12_FULL_58_15]OGR13736.1 MAG: hypothetical protein A2341_20530 [Deltaproteobacteria bacterium RIFOXYB12_FULL_58_9]
MARAPQPLLPEAVKIGPLASLTRTERERLVASVKPMRFDSGATVLTEGEDPEWFFVLLAGSVRVFYRSEEGEELVCKLFGAPAVFGEMECLTGIAYQESVRTLETSTLLKVPSAYFVELIGQNAGFARAMLKDLARRLCIAADHERALAFQQVDSRLANLLLSYVELYGVPTSVGILVRIVITKKSLARDLGVARRSIHRTIQIWTEQGILAMHGRQLLVKNIKELTTLSGHHRFRLDHRS